jgi:DNA-binding CsgD family transcriptional regulator
VWKDSGAARVELGPLDRPQTDALAEEITGGPVEEAARQWIHQASLGNALYVAELTRGALAGGALTQDRGLWRLARRPAISASLTELITARLAGLPEASADALELLALGEPLPVDELVELTSDRAVGDLEARGLIRVSELAGGDVSLSHPLYGEAVRDGLPAFRRRQAQLRLARAIQRRDRVPDRDLLRMATWLSGAGTELPAATLLEASVVASGSGDPELGAELAGRALAAGGGLRAALLLARAYVLQGRYADADKALAPVAAVVDPPGAEGAKSADGAGKPAKPQAGQPVAFGYLELKTTILCWGLRQVSAAQQLRDRARAWWADPGWQQRVDALAAAGYELPSAASLAAVAQAYTDEDADPEARRRIAPVHVANLFYSGRVRESYELVCRLPAALPPRDVADERALMLRSAIALESGLGWPELEAWAVALLADAARLGDHGVVGRAALSLGNLRFSQARYLEAGRLLTEAELHLEQRDPGGGLAVARAMQVGVATFTGNYAGIGPALERCRAVLGDGEPLPNELPYVARAHGWAVLGLGDRPRAQRLFLDAAERLAEVPVYASRLTYEALRAGAKPRQLALRLQALAQRCDGRLTAAYAAHATGLAAGDGDALLVVAQEMEAIGAMRYATEAAAGAASAYATAGRTQSARRAATRSRELHGRGEGGLPPVIPELDPAATGLTARERELVELTARGLSNAEIAAQLFLSIRTVESHLYRAMHKLGVTSRHELPGARPDDA